MSVVTNDLREKAVLAEVIKRIPTNFPLHTLARDLTGNMGRGDKIDIPVYSDSLTAEDASTSTGASVDVTIQTAAATPRTLSVDQHKAIFLDVPKMSRLFDVSGAWAGQVADLLLQKMNMVIDDSIMTDWIQSAYHATAGTYWTGAAGASLDTTKINTAIALATSQDGAEVSDLTFILSPYGVGSLMNIAGYTPDPGFIGNDRVGLNRLGFINGIPVVISQRVTTRLTAAITAATVASNVATLTITPPASGIGSTYANHPFVPGMLATTSGLTANASSAVAITSVTPTQVVLPITAADGAMADGVGTITVDVAVNGILNRKLAFVARPQVPEVRIVPRQNRDSDVLQCTAVWGRTTIPGAFIAMGSPRNAI